MPMPGPRSSQFRRSRGEPSANRGYHAKGIEITRPSCSSTTRKRSVTRTLVAAAVSVRFEVVIPCLHEESFVLLDETSDPLQFRFAEAVGVCHSNRRQPNLRELPITLHMDVNGFPAVARKEEEAVRPALQNRWTHLAKLCQLFQQGPNGAEIRLTAAAHPRRPRTNVLITSFSHRPPSGAAAC